MLFVRRLMMSLPLQLLASIFLSLMAESVLPDLLVAGFYTLSCLFKDLLMMVIPFVVFGYLMSSIISFDKRSLLVIGGVFGLVTASNALTMVVAYGVGGLLFTHLPFPEMTALATASATTLTPLWVLPVKAPENAPMVAMIAAFGLGMGGVFGDFPFLKRLAHRVREDAITVLRRGFIPLLPLYVFGFILKLQHDKTFGLLVQGYGQIFALSCLIIVAYILLAYGFAARFRWNRFKHILLNMLPAGVTAFTTMSSAATLPANNHMIGDGLNIALSSLALLIMTNQGMPDVSNYALFTFYYCLAKFSTAGVPGGGVLVILPLAQMYLGLNANLASILTTLYVLQDPLITAANVMGNGAFAVLTAPLFQRRRRDAGKA